MKKSLLLVASLIATLAVQAQDIPRKTLTLVVGFAAGGAADTAARLVAKKVGESLGQTVVVDNRAGAGGNIAHQFVDNAVPDGGTILMPRSSARRSTRSSAAATIGSRSIGRRRAGSSAAVRE